MRCINDGGECALGGYCAECPWKRIKELEKQLTAANKEIEFTQQSNMYKRIESMKEYMQSQRLFPDGQITHWDNYLRLKGEES